MLPGVAVIGLGKLGAPIAACLAAKGFGVIGVDTDPKKLEVVRQRRLPVYEPGLTEMLKKAGNNLTATDRIEEAVQVTELIFILVPTPSEPEGGFSLCHVLPACAAIGRALKADARRHIVVLTSTVMPGSTGGAVRAALEEASGKRAGNDFGLCYNPEFVALGSVVRDFLEPDFILIGESDAASGERLAGLYARVCENRPSVARMNFVNAEITKLALNTYVTAKIGFANMLARICEKLPGASVEAVTEALGLDSRIGPRYLAGAISYGGPCFPRDNRALALLAQHLGVPCDIPESTDKLNRWHVGWLAGVVEGYLRPEGTVAILGLTYKPETDVVEEAFGLLLAKELARRGRRVVGYDPAGNANAARELAGAAQVARSARESLDDAEVVVVATPWRGFREIPAAHWSRHSPPRVVIDCWRILGHLREARGVLYFPLGTGDKLGTASRSQRAGDSC